MNKDDFYNKARFGEITGIGGLSETHAFNDGQYSMNNEIDNLSPQEYLLEKALEAMEREKNKITSGNGYVDILLVMSIICTIIMVVGIITFIII